jgi:hypothetical protein
MSEFEQLSQATFSMTNDPAVYRLAGICILYILRVTWGVQTVEKDKDV